MDKTKSDEIEAYVPELNKKPAAPVVTDSNEVADDDANPQRCRLPNYR